MAADQHDDIRRLTADLAASRRATDRMEAVLHHVEVRTSVRAVCNV